MVGQSKTAIVVVAILAAACAGAAVGETTTTSQVVVSESTTTTTVVETTTTTEAVGPVDLCGAGRPVRFDDVTSYTADCFVIPVGFEQPPGDWRADEVTEQAVVFVRQVDLSGVASDLVVALVAEGSAGGVESAVESISSRDVLTVLGSPEPVDGSGWSGVVFDVEGAIGRDGACGEGYRPVTGGSLSIHWRIAGSPSIKAPRAYGVGTCRVVRVWVLDVASRTVFVIAGTEEPEGHRSAMSVAEDLLATITFATP